MSVAIKKGADALLDAIRANGVDTIFGLPGGQLNDLFDAIYRAEGGISYFGSRHEQGAAYMAFGYAKSTGKVGAYTVVPGPGVLNTTAAICSAYANSTPVLCVTGQIPSHAIGRGVGELHELPDQLATLRTLTKWATRIDHPSQINSLVNDAFRELTIGRPRPVAIEMPPDVMAMHGPSSAPSAFVSDSASIFDQDLVAEAAKAIELSKSPLIVVGGGAQHASDEVVRLAELIKAPVLSFRNGRGIVSDAHPLGCNFIAGYELWKTADLVIGIGSRMQPYLQEWGVDDEITLIRIDWDPTELNRITKADIGICGDARSVVAALTEACARTLSRRIDRTTEISAAKARASAAIEEIPEQKAYLEAIRAELPDDGILVDEITQVGFASWISFPVYRPRSLITCGYQGTLGYGYATALGVKIGNPQKPVVAIAGDGGFMFQVQELATAAQYQISLPVIVFNNGRFGNVRRHQEEWYSGRVIGSTLHNPKFAALAETFGVAGYKADSPQSLRVALKRALNVSGPSLIEVEAGDMSSPWKFILRERVRGATPRH
jgi:acetolactate synthase-1/2/3 large subunit